MSETTTFRWSLEEDIVRYAAAGIYAIGVWRQKLSDCGLAKAVDLLRHARLKVSHLSWAGGFTGSDGRSHRESIEDAVEAVHAAAELGCPTLVLYSGARSGHTANHARRLFLAALNELVPLADELDVTLAVEPMHPGCAEQWTFLTSLDETLEVLEMVDGGRVKLVFDTYHLGQDADVLRRAATIAPRVALVQLGDARHPPQGEQDRCRLGEGVVPLGEIVASLRSGGYDGYYDVELLGEEIEAFDYESLLVHARTAFRKLLTDAA